MSTDDDDELERIREQKKQEILENAGGGASGDDAGQSTSAPEEPIQISGGDHLQTVIDEHDVVLVDCYADWCGPCQMMEPVVEDLAATSSAAVAKLDVDANQRIAAELGAQSIPTLIVYAEGEPVQRLVGAQDRATLESVLAEAGA